LKKSWDFERLQSKILLGRKAHGCTNGS
jgi:hypothetical protein